MYLENENIRLRALEPEDLEILYKWENDTSIWQVGCTTEPYSRYILKEYIAYSDKTIYEKKQLRLMITRKDDDVTVGTIDLTDFDPHNLRAGVGILIDSTYRGEGYALQAVQLIKEYAFRFLHLKQLYAHIPVTIPASMHIFQQNGFEQTGIMHQWIRHNEAFVDVTLWQCLNH